MELACRCTLVALPPSAHSRCDCAVEERVWTRTRAAVSGLLRAAVGLMHTVRPGLAVLPVDPDGVIMGVIYVVLVCVTLCTAPCV